MQKKINKTIEKIVPKRYKLILKEINTDQISFARFYGKSVLVWCTKHCAYSKICGHCPSSQNNYNKKFRKKILSFKKGFIVILKIPANEFAGKNVIKKRLPAKSQHVLNLLLSRSRQILEEKDNKKFLLLGGGPCKLTYCWNKSCNLLRYKRCKYSNLTYPAMESCGINVFKTIKDLGHKIYWIDNKTKTKEIPYGLRVGLILFN